MLVFRLIIILLFIIVIYYLKSFIKLNRNKKIQKNKNLNNFNKTNLNIWMNLTKKERYDLSKQESINYLNKRKVLLEEIRKEYKKISKKKSN